MKVKSESEVAQSCLTLATPWTAAYQASPFIFQARVLEWGAIAFSEDTCVHTAKTITALLIDYTPRQNKRFKRKKKKKKNQQGNKLNKNEPGSEFFPKALEEKSV